MEQTMEQTKRRRTLSVVLPVIGIFLCLLILLSICFGLLPAQAERERLAAIQERIDHAMALCYATEGRYPPNWRYLNDNYNVGLNLSRYTVELMPYEEGGAPAYVVRPAD